MFKRIFSGLAKDLGIVKKLAPYAAKYKTYLFFAIITLVLTDVLIVVQPVLVKYGIDTNIGNKDFEGLKVTALWLLGAMIAGFLLNIVMQLGIQYLGQKILCDIRLDLFRKVLCLSNDYYDKTPVGKTLTNVTTDVETIYQFMSEGIVVVVGDLFKVVLIFFAIYMINVKLAMIATFTIPIFVITTLLFRNSIRTGHRGVREANSEINRMVVETITGIREVVQFNYRKKARIQFEEANSNYLKYYLKVVKAYAGYFPVIEIVSGVNMVMVFFYAHKSMGVEVKAGEIVAFFTFITMFFRPLRQLAEKFNMFQSSMAASERIFKLLEENISVRNKSTSEACSVKKGAGIVFDDVTFSYKEGVPVLENVSLEIKPGEKVAFVGPTGSGKTTAVKLVSRLYDVDSGSIKVDGEDVREMRIGSLREGVSVVPQEPFIFKGSVADNISLFRGDGVDEKMKNAAESTNASAFINSLENGYQQELNAGGSSLSEGEKQLLSITRAIYDDPSVLIFDEATSNIDSRSENYIEAATKELVKGRTSIVIAHRLSTIRMVDRIFVFAKGKIVESGSHDELIEAGGLYSDLYETQASALR